MLEQYTEWAQYPPHSRPISSLNDDIIHPFTIGINAITMVDSPTEKEGNGYRCHLQPKEWAVIGLGNDMFIKLECRDSSNELVKVNVVNATVFKEFEDQKLLLIALTIMMMVVMGMKLQKMESLLSVGDLSRQIGDKCL